MAELGRMQNLIIGRHRPVYFSLVVCLIVVCLIVMSPVSGVKIVRPSRQLQTTTTTSIARGGSDRFTTDSACEVNSTIISFREDVPPGTVIMRIPRQTREQWAFREDGPPGFIELRAYQHSVVFYFAATPDLERLNNGTGLVRGSLPFTLECSSNGWKYVFKQEIVLLDVNDNDPHFDPDRPSSISVSENTSPGASVLDLRGFARDRDVTGHISAYNVTHHSDTENDGFDFFAVSGSDLIVRQTLDFDLLRQKGRSYYVINLTAVDNGFPMARRAYTSLVVNITDSDDLGPAFVYTDCPLLDGYCTTPLYETVAKKSFTGQLKVWPGQIRATDMDSMNNTILYFIVKVIPEEFSKHFRMDPVTGEVTVTEAFDRDDIDAIHITIKAEERSVNRRSLTTTLRVQVVGDYYVNYNDNIRNVPVNQAVEARSSSDNGQTTVPVSMFIATVGAFFIVVISFPFIIIRVMKGKLLPEPPGVTSLQLTGDCGSPEGSRKESSDTTMTSILTCTSTDTGCTVYGPRKDNDSDTTSTSSSSSSTNTSHNSSVRLDFDDAISFANPVSDPSRRVSSVSFDPQEVSSRFSPPVPTKHPESATSRFKRRLSDLLNIRASKDRRKSRVRFDIRSMSNFS